MAFWRTLLVAAVLSAVTIPALAKDTVVVIPWPGVQRAQLRIAALEVAYFPKIRNAVCHSYRHGTFPGRALAGGGIVRVNIVGAANEVIASFRITRDKCG